MGHMWYHPLGRTFYYMSTRNNDFTNRSQKATIVVKAWKLYLIVGSVVLALALLLPARRDRASASAVRPGPPSARVVRWRLLLHWGRHASTAGITARGSTRRRGRCRHRSSALVFYALGYWHAIWPKRADPAPYYPHAKGCGRVLDLTCNLIFLPVLRNLISWLRTTPLRRCSRWGGDLLPQADRDVDPRADGGAYPLPLPGLRVARAARRG